MLTNWGTNLKKTLKLDVNLKGGFKKELLRWDTCDKLQDL